MKIIKRLSPHLPVILLWTAVWSLFFYPILLGIERLPNSDFSGQFHAFGLFHARSFADGVFPLWSPHSYAGFPFAADTQTAVYYLPRWLTIWLTDMSYQGLQLEGVLHIWLAGLFTYGLAYDLTKKRDAGLLAALCFGLGGYLTSYPLLQLAVLETITWLPLALLLVRRTVLQERPSRSQHPLRGLLAIGFVLGISALAGHPQTFLHVSTLTALYFLFQAWQADWSWRWILGGGMAVAGVALGMATAVYLPALNYLQLATRSDVGYEYIASGQPLFNYVQWLIPSSRAVWSPEYVSIGGLMLAVFALFAHRWSKQRAELLFWGCVVLFGSWLALGDKGVLFELAYRVLPGFSLFRQQERLLGLVSLAWAMLAAQGLVLWLQLPSQEKKPLLYHIGLLFLGGLLVCAGLLWVSQSLNIVTMFHVLGWVALSLILLFIINDVGKTRYNTEQNTQIRGIRVIRVKKIFLLFIIVFDLIISLQPILNLQGEPTAVWQAPSWLTTLKAEDELGRIDSSNLFYANFGEATGLRDIRGISPLKLQVAEQYQAIPKPRRWQLLNVTHVISQEPPAEDWTAIAQVEESVLAGESLVATVYRYESALPPAWMVYEPLVVTDNDAMFATLSSPEFAPARQVVLTKPVDPLITPNNEPVVQTERPSAHETHITVQTETDGLLVISQWAYDGWQVQVDGVDNELLTVNGGLQGVVVPAGEHEVMVRYRPWDVPLGLGIAVLTLLIAGVLAVVYQPLLIKGRPTWSWPTIPVPALPDLRVLLMSHWFLLAVLFIAFGLRMATVATQELRGDEAFSYIFASYPADEIVPRLLGDGDPHSPLHYWLVHYGMRLFGDSELALRWQSVLLGLLVVALTARLGRLFGGRVVAGGTAVFLALSPAHIWMSHDVRSQYNLALLFGLGATFVWHKALHNKRWWLAYAVLAALCVYAHYYGAFLLLAHGIALLARTDRWKQLPFWILGGVGAVLLFLPWGWVALSRLGETGQFSTFAPPDLARHLTALGTQLVAGALEGNGWQRWAFLLPFLGILFGFYRSKENRMVWLFLLSWILCVWVCIWGIRFRRDIFNTFYGVMAAPAWCLALSLLAFEAKQKRWVGWLVGVGVTAVSLFALFPYLTNIDYQRGNGYRPMAAEIKSQWQEGDLFLANAPDPSLVYYLRDIPIRYEMQPAKVGLTPAETEQAVAQLTSKQNRIWFVSMDWWDSQRVVNRWLDYHLLHEQTTQHRQIRLRAFRTLQDVDTVMQPAMQEAQTMPLQLNQFYITVDGQPMQGESIPITPQQQLDVTLLWQTNDVIPEDYTVFVHVLGADGRLLAQHDGIPLVGTRPTSSWQAGELLLDRHPITLPDALPESGIIKVGLYHPTTFERVLFEGDTDGVTITSFGNTR